MATTLLSGKALPRRQRNELRFRKIFVSDKQLIAEQFWRITLSGEDLQGFDSPGTDDHIKLFFTEGSIEQVALPTVSDDGIVWPNGRPMARDYTPLTFDGENHLVIDFFRHTTGIATQWAEQAQMGDGLIIGGPRGSYIAATDYQQQVYILDESGLPSLKRRLAVSQAEMNHVFVFADKTLTERYLGTLPENVRIHCLNAPQSDSSAMETLMTQLADISLPTEDYFIWITGEGEAVKGLSDYFIEQRHCSPALVRAVAYWHHKAS